MLTNRVWDHICIASFFFGSILTPYLFIVIFNRDWLQETYLIEINFVHALAFINHFFFPFFEHIWWFVYSASDLRYCNVFVAFSPSSLDKETYSCFCYFVLVFSKFKETWPLEYEILVN